MKKSDREKRNAYMRTYQVMRRNEYRILGICLNCHKRKAAQNHRCCNVCMRAKRGGRNRMYPFNKADTIKNFFQKQNGKCAICGKNRKLLLDHCHKTNKRRGLLCSSCNIGLGMFQDNTQLLETAINYLKPQKNKLLVSG